MTNEQALEEFKFAVNHWFKLMDYETRQKAMQAADDAFCMPYGEVLHKPVTVDKPVPQGRSGSFVGKVWMLNRATGERARVEPHRVVAFEACGFERGGPRSK